MTRIRRDLARARRKREAYSPSGVVAMSVLVPLMLFVAGWAAWLMFVTFIVEGTGLWDDVTVARAPTPAILLLIAGPLLILGSLHLAWDGGSWLYRVATGQVPRATEAQRNGRT